VNRFVKIEVDDDWPLVTDLLPKLLDSTVETVMNYQRLAPASRLLSCFHTDEFDTLACRIGDPDVGLSIIPESPPRNLADFQIRFCCHFASIIVPDRCAMNTVIPHHSHEALSNLAGFWEEGQSKFDRQVRAAQKCREAFFRELENGTGPWSMPSRNLPFTAANRISRCGRRVLMFINYKIRDHLDASRSKKTGQTEQSMQPEFFF
jgi:hypothetical protein